MRTKALTHVCNITTGKLDSNAAVVNGIYPFYTCAPEASSIDEFAFDCDAILLAGNNAQGNFHISRYNGNFNAYQRTYVITAKDGYDIDYIKYSIELSLKHLKNVAQGSQTKFLTMQLLDSFHVADVPLEIQHNEIGAIREIDKKFSLKTRVCAELESMAKTLYDYWFVQFDFPDADGRPYRTSGGAMVWNDELKREVPEGWGGGNLYKIANFVNGLACQRYRPTDDEASLPVIKIREIHEGCTADTERVSANIPDQHKIHSGDILFSWSATLEVVLWYGEDGGLNQHIFKVFPKDGYGKEFVYHQLSKYVINFVKMAEARKTTMGNITTDHLNQSRIAIPSTEIILSFCASVRPIHEKIRACHSENRELAALRDWLLPMLMNGQARVE